MKSLSNNSVFIRLIVRIIIFTHVFALSACNNTMVRESPNEAELVKIGPQFSETIENEEKDTNPIMTSGTKLDVIIPVFDPGLSDLAVNYEEEGIWPELRRAEANRFAFKLKQALDETQRFGAVRVTPDKTASGDLYILGEILKSDGEDVEFNLTVIDISGKKWLDDKFAHEVTEGFYKNLRNKGSDPYDPAFKNAAEKIASLLKDKSNPELSRLKDIAQLRFGASFNQEAFMEYLNTDNNYFQLTAMPSDDDPILKRVSSIRVREQLFVDSLQQNYQSFSESMDDSYAKWQKAAFQEKLLRAKAKKKAVLETIGGVLLFGLAFAMAANTNSNSAVANNAATTAAVAGGIAGAWMLSNSFKSREEAKLHKDALDELGESINLELAPQVINYEEESVELTGNITEQFSQWRAFMKKIYEQESTPEQAI